MYACTGSITVTACRFQNVQLVNAECGQQNPHFLQRHVACAVYACAPIIKPDAPGVGHHEHWGSWSESLARADYQSMKGTSYVTIFSLAA